MSTKQIRQKKAAPSTPSKNIIKDAGDKSINVVTPVAAKTRTDQATVTPKKSREPKKAPLIGDELDDNNEENLNTSNIVSPSKQIKSTLRVDPSVEKVYKIVKKATGALDGNGSTGAIYGELTTRALQRVYNIMVEKCNMTSASRMIDVGAGLGKPNFHAAQDPAVRLSIGAELEDIRWNVSMIFTYSYCT